MSKNVKIELRDESDVLVVASFLNTIMDNAISSFKDKDEAYQAVSELDEEALKKYAVLGVHIVSASDFMNGEAKKAVIAEIAKHIQDGNGLKIPTDEDGEDVEEEYVRPAVDKPDVMYG